MMAAWLLTRIIPKDIFHAARALRVHTLRCESTTTLNQPDFPPPRSSTTSATTSGSSVTLLGVEHSTDHMTNVTPRICSLVGRNLHLAPHNPVNIIKQRVVHHFHKTYVSRTGNAHYAHFDTVPPVVSTEQNFDSLLIPKDHVSRCKTDNYYINQSTVLRGHTSAHQRDFVRMGLNRFLVTGDVYRRDEIDRNHYPVFHQMEGVRLFTRPELFQSCRSDEILLLFEEDGSSSCAETIDKQKTHTIDAAKMMEVDLKKTLVNLVKELFGNDIEFRWNSCYFPFTHPSYELEIKFEGEWLEVLGSGIMRQEILDNGGASDRIGWAFGLGLDRLAMLFFDIPDIRYLWSQDERFTKQFVNVGVDPKTNIKFVPFSKCPPVYKDITFWLPEERKGTDASAAGFSDTDFSDLVRSVGGDLVEMVRMVDEYVQEGSGRVSRCYRITYRSMERTLTNDEINVLQNTIRKECQNSLNLELR